MGINVQNTPWECDDIVFLPGDWEILRASEEGKYQYSVSGILSRNLASAVDLVKWKMAKNLSLDLLLPWDNEGITFTGEVDILRDFLSVSQKEKYYLIRDQNSSTILLRVNKYFLIQKGHATPSEELKRTIASKKVKSKQYNRSCEPWPEDDIFILDTNGDETITRGAVVGQYRVRSGGMSRNWRADVLISEHKAISGYDVRLSELSSCDNVSLKDYYDATCGFWLTKVGTVPSFREIAHIWCSLQHNPCGDIAKSLMSDLDNAILSIDLFADKFADFDDKANIVDNAIKTVQPEVIELENIFHVCKNYQNQTILDDLTAFHEVAESFNSTKIKIDVAYKKISKSFSEVEGSLISIKQDISQIGQLEFFPHEVLPIECVQYLQQKEDEYLSKLRDLRDISLYESRLADLSSMIELIESVLTQMNIADIESYVKIMMERKEELDSLREIICKDEKFKKKPGLFTKPNKEDGIKFTTGIQIKSKSAGKYSVTYSAGLIELTVLELIYIGLAERV